VSSARIPEPSADPLRGHRLLPDDELPDWFAPMVRAVDGVDRADLVAMPFGPAPRTGVRQSAVLMLFGSDPETGPDLLLTARADTLSSHAGQPAFPGGRAEPGETAVQTALREAMEETGLDPAGVVPAALLPELYLLPSRNVVTPVLAWWPRPSAIRAVDPAETAAVARVPVAQLVDPANRVCTVHPSGHLGPGFTVAGMVVWGFTGMLVDLLLRLGGWERPWDRDRLVELPARPSGLPVPDPEIGRLDADR
jgi:8-oxo-dGTP pyrophosphatase MutT (NUDIX family)